MRLLAYRVLSGIVGALFIAAGLMLFASFVGYQEPGSVPGIPTGPVGHYFVAFSGCAMVGWGGGLMGAARNPSSGRTVGTATAFALVMMGVYRMLAWYVGDYYAWLGELARAEAVLFFAMALAFVWLRPASPRAAQVA
jgi:hypothetical protein